MDSLTQIVLGSSVAEATIGKRVGNKAILWGAIAGTIPDLDVFVDRFVEPLRAVELHRGFSHSILFCLLMAPILGWVINKIHHKANATWKNWTWMAFMCLITHPLLDAHTTWGTQLFWPFELKVAYRNIFVADPLYTIPFLICLIIVMVHKRSNPRRRFYNKLGILISSFYMLLTIVFKSVVYFKFTDSLEAQNIKYKAITTRPTFLNSILWTANIETEEAFLIGYYSLFDKNDDIRFKPFKKDWHLLNEIRDDNYVPRLIRLSNGWYTIEERYGKLYFNDLRFGQASVGNPDSDFVFRYELYPESGKLKIKQIEPKFDDIIPALENTYTRLKGL